MHILIGGGGQVAKLIAGRLIREGNEVVLVEQDEDRCAYLEEELDAKVVCGSVASPSTLREAGLAHAEMLIAVTSSDESNLLACLIAQVESSVRVKIARLRTHEVDHWRRVAADAGVEIQMIIHPETALAERILGVIKLPGVSEILEFAGGEARFFGMNVNRDSWLVGKSLFQLEEAGPPDDSLVAMISRSSQIVIPHGGELILEGDHVYCMATRENVSAVLRFMGVQERQRLDRVFIVGGKQIGILLAEILEKDGVSVKIFDKDAKRCAKMSEILKKSIVIHGDGTDQATLEEENIEDVDAFLALTNDDEDNIIASLLARRLGAGKIVALVNRLNYLSMVQRLGVNATVSPRVAAVDAILQHVRKGRVLSVTTIQEEQAEAIEMIASQGSRYVGRMLRDTRFPRGVIVGAIARPSGQLIIPRGDATIQPGDRVLFFTLASHVPKLESAFLV